MHLTPEDRALIHAFLHGVQEMSKITDRIAAASASIAASTAALQATGLDDPALDPAVTDLEAKVAALAALVTPPALAAAEGAAAPAAG